MRRIVATLAVCSAASLLAFGVGAGGDDGTYEVRAIFDSAGFLVPGEEVRVAGAKVGSVSDLDVTTPDEAARESGASEPGKAVVVLRIDDPAFQDFRADASCLIRPQSLIGEKFVDCEPTQPRAPGTEPPPPLEEIAEGQAGEGQHLLPLERNGKAVDLDLVNNIMRAPYPDRFRLILNDLGAGLAARGDELAEVVERSNPALRETNEVLAILARQNRALAGLATDSDAILSALAREREHVASFINQATTVGEATAERAADLEESFARFPGFLRELRSTMVELRAFSDQATPVFGDLRMAAPSLTRATRLLEPFSEAGTAALTTLGDAAEEAGDPFVAADPVIRQLRDLGRDAAAPSRDLAKLLSTLQRTDGFEHLLEAIFGLGGSVNGFDSYGHFLRALIPVNTCFDYVSGLQAGCGANFTGSAVPPTTSSARALAASWRTPIADASDPRSGANASGGTGSGPATSGEGSPGASATLERVPDAAAIEAVLELMLGPAAAPQPQPEPPAEAPAAQPEAKR